MKILAVSVFRDEHLGEVHMSTNINGVQYSSTGELSFGLALAHLMDVLLDHAAPIDSYDAFVFSRDS